MNTREWYKSPEGLLTLAGISVRLGHENRTQAAVARRYYLDALISLLQALA